MLNLSVDECRTIDAELEKTLAWAQVRTAEAEQLAFDATRLLSCTEDRFKDLKNQHFFKRCWGRFSGKTGEIERANTSDLIQMQKMSFRYLNLLQERDLLLGHAMLSLKNNLLSLAVKETETRNMIQLLAERTRNRFDQLESRVDQLEVSVNIQGWLLTIEERGYAQKFPTSYLRMLRLANDFYGYKKDNWNYQDLLFMRSALRKSALMPEQHINMDGLIDCLVDEIYETDFDQYQNLLIQWKPPSIENYSEFILDNISCQVGATLHGLVYQYVDRMEIVEELKEELSISEEDALKRLLKKAIKKLNVDLEVQIPLAEIVFEIFGYMRLVEKLAESIHKAEKENEFTVHSDHRPCDEPKENNDYQSENKSKETINQKEDFSEERLTAGIYTYITHKNGVADDSALELLSAAKRVDPRASITAIVTGSGGDVDKVAATIAASYVNVTTYKNDALSYPNAEVVRKLLTSVIPKGAILFVPHNTFGMDLSPGLSIKLGAVFLSDIIDIISVSGTQVKAVRQEYSGMVATHVTCDISNGAVINIRPGAFVPDESRAGFGAVEDKSGTIGDLSAKRKFLEVVEAEVGDVGITKADVLVSVGRGIEDQENIAIVQDLADAMGAMLSCSRTLTDAKWIEKSRQVGTAGQTVKPKIYMACGISGSFRHLAGLKESPFIVAINKNPKAPIFQVADVGIEANILEFLPELTAAIKRL